MLRKKPVTGDSFGCNALQLFHCSVNIVRIFLSHSHSRTPSCKSTNTTKSSDTTKGAILTGQTRCGSVQFGSLWFTLVAWAVKITTFHFGSIWRLLIYKKLRISMIISIITNYRSIGEAAW